MASVPVCDGCGLQTHRVEEEHKQFMREMRELEGMGAHSALLKMNKYLRR